jgi:hypothetical protein
MNAFGANWQQIPAIGPNPAGMTVEMDLES